MCYMTRQLLPSPSEGALIGAGGREEPSAPLPVWAAERSPELGETRLVTDPCPLGAPLLPPSGRGKAACSGYPIETRRPCSASDRGRGWRKPAAGLLAHGARLQGSRVWDVLLEGLLGGLFNSSASLERKREKLYYRQDL